VRLRSWCLGLFTLLKRCIDLFDGSGVAVSVDVRLRKSGSRCTASLLSKGGVALRCCCSIGVEGESEVYFSDRDGPGKNIAVASSY
jgi:hypothetical protein